jgi:hypothetical protein
MAIKYLYFFLLILFTCPLPSISQTNEYNLKNPGQEIGEKCNRCLDGLKKKPIEVQMASTITPNNDIIFYITDPAWFDIFFKNKSDGLAIDLVQKDQFRCGEKNRLKKTFYRGILMPPVYTKDLKKNSLILENGVLVIKLGVLPASLIGKEIEANVIYIQDNYICHQQKLYNVEVYGWDLLDMGMFLDSLVYNDPSKVLADSLTQVVANDKRMKFIIPFEKNKSEYSKEDIKPIYDSLNLTDYEIKTITIKAYSSVEGSEEKNIALQQKRAASIVGALQSFQKPTILTHIFASENWVEFYNDVANTEYKYLSNLSKVDIKEQLKDKTINDALESYLRLHRKAVLVIELNKKTTLSDVKPDILITMFDQAIKDKNIERAKEIQNSIYYRIRNKQLANSFATNLTIPKQIEYGQLLINNSMLQYFVDEDVYAAYLELQELEDILPKDEKIKYNLCVLRFRLILKGEHIVKPEDLKLSIDQLKSYRIAKKLIDRMGVNYNIIMCESYMLKKDYFNKDKCLKYIQANYKFVPMTDHDRVSLAQYLSMYSKYDWAIKVLEPEISKVDAEEDLIFYYLNLTIGDPKITNKENYKVVMLNAINANPARFCKMFDSVKNGGVSFQLLEYDLLKKIYCENCSGKKI